MILPFLFAAATVLGFGERPAADLQLVPMAAYPQIASNGRGFVAAWTGTRNNDAFLFRASIDGTGAVVDSRPIAKELSYDISRIASDGDRYLVALAYSRKGFLLDEHGDLVREIALPPCDALASNGSGYAIVVPSNAVQLLDREGDPIGGQVSVSERIVAIAAAGQGYILLTHDGRNLFVRTLSHGNLSSPTAVGYFPTSMGDVVSPFSAAVASNGSEALIAVRGGDSIRVFPFHDGVIGSPKDIRRENDFSYVSVLWTGNEFIVSDQNASGTTLTHVSHDGSVLSRPIVIEREPGSVAWNGWRLLFAGKATTRLYTASPTFLAAGDAQPFAPYAAAQWRPRIATDGESALVMWLEPFSGLRLSRIASDGSHADGAGISIELPDGSETGAVAWDGNEWVIAYPSRDGVRLRTMTRDGILSPAKLFPSVTAVVGVRIASGDDGHFALIWEALNPPRNPDSGVIRVSIDGESPIDLTHQINAHPDVTWDAGAFRMVWMNYEFRSTPPPGLPDSYTVPVAVTFATMERNGQLSITGTTETGSDQRPRVAREFTMFVKDGVKVRRGADEIALDAAVSASEPPAFAVDDDGHALLVSPGGRAVLIGAGEPQSFVAAQDAGTPDVVWTHNGWMMVYTRVVDEAPYNHVQRVFIRTLDTTPARRRTF